MMRKGFTLIELLVASLLLGMLVSALTMLFNASSVAWRTGTAGVAKMQDVRTTLGTVHEIRDEALPGVGDQAAKMSSRRLQYRTVSIWDPNGTTRLRTDTAGRSYYDIKWGRASSGSFTLNDAKKGGEKTIGSSTTVGSGLFTVGVRSAGPDREFGTDDDISTWPEDLF